MYIWTYTMVLYTGTNTKQQLIHLFVTTNSRLKSDWISKLEMADSVFFFFIFTSGFRKWSEVLALWLYLLLLSEAILAFLFTQFQQGVFIQLLWAYIFIKILIKSSMLNLKSDLILMGFLKLKFKSIFSFPFILFEMFWYFTEESVVNIQAQN